MNIIHLKIIALLILMIYLASPLATLAARSNAIALAFIGECAGDCARCGCSPERSEAKTCCCWQKRLHSHCERHEDPPECCQKTKKGSSLPVLSSSQCGSKKMLAVWGEDEQQLLPDRFAASIILLGKPLLCLAPERLTSCYNEPPDQPPEPAGLS